jgi:hypothetical protein
LRDYAKLGALAERHVYGERLLPRGWADCAPTPTHTRTSYAACFRTNIGIGRVYCTGPGGIWVMAPDGRRIGMIWWPEQAVNFAFGGPDPRTLFCCAHTSVYTLRVKVPGNPHPWYKQRGQ